jgi:hypothetical protein
MAYGQSRHDRIGDSLGIFWNSHKHWPCYHDPNLKHVDVPSTSSCDPFYDLEWPSLRQKVFPDEVETNLERIRQ